MTGQTESGGSGELQQDALVEQLASEPSQLQPMRILVGFLGKSTQEGYQRLYFTPDLSEYVEVPPGGILHTRPLPPEQSALGGTMVWVKGDTTLEYRRIVSSQVQAAFLQGGDFAPFVAASGMESTLAGAQGPMWRFPITWVPWLCPSRWCWSWMCRF